MFQNESSSGKIETFEIAIPVFSSSKGSLQRLISFQRTWKLPFSFRRNVKMKVKIKAENRKNQREERLREIREPS